MKHNHTLLALVLSVPLFSACASGGVVGNVSGNANGCIVSITPMNAIEGWMLLSVPYIAENKTSIEFELDVQDASEASLSVGSPDGSKTWTTSDGNDVIKITYYDLATTDQQVKVVRDGSKVYDEPFTPSDNSTDPSGEWKVTKISNEPEVHRFTFVLDQKAYAFTVKGKLDDKILEHDVAP